MKQYEKKVKPRLKEVSEMVLTMPEKDIAKELGISAATLRNYKKEFPELAKCFENSKQLLAKDLKKTLKQKAKGFYFKEIRRTYIEDSDGNIKGDIKVEETEKYCPPDTGAIHLLLKNLDDEWRNDDKETMNLKREKIELEKKKAEIENW